jgi:hypothetical protein
MNVSIYTLGGWVTQHGAVLRSGSTANIHYVTLSTGSLEQVPEGMGPLRISLDGVESLAVSPVGPSLEGRGLEFLVVMPRAMRRALGA